MLTFMDGRANGVTAIIVPLNAASISAMLIRDSGQGALAIETKLARWPMTGPLLIEARVRSHAFVPSVPIA